MAEKQVTLEDLARMEAQALKKREQARIAYAEGQKRLVKEIPERFFIMAKQIRDGVRRFNETAYAESGSAGRIIKYEESVGLTTKDMTLGGEYNLEIKRAPNFMTLGLRNMARPGRPDSFLIEGYGSIGLAPMNDRFVLRIDAYCTPDGEVHYRATCNFQKIDTAIDDVAERAVMVIITTELSRFWNQPPWLDVPTRKKGPTTL